MEPVRNGLVWEATKEGKTIYFAGTLHKGFTELPVLIEERLEQITRVYLEVIPDKPLGFIGSIRGGYHAAFLMSEFLVENDEVFEEKKDFVAHRIVPACNAVFDTKETADAWKAQANSPLGPVADAAQTVADLINKRFSENSTSIDKLILNSAIAKKISVKPLESPVDHIKITTKDSLYTISECYRNMRKSEEAIRNWVLTLRDFDVNIIDAVMRGDIPALEAAVNTLGKYEDWARRSELKARNEQIAKKVDKYAKKKKPIMVAVGALHYLGEYSLLNMMESKGWQVRKL